MFHPSPGLPPDPMLYLGNFKNKKPHFAIPIHINN